jgi:hypothetical protein
MKSLLEQVGEIDSLIHQLEKMESKLRSGAIIDAWRECNRLVAALNKAKQDLLADSEKKNEE